MCVWERGRGEEWDGDRIGDIDERSEEKKGKEGSERVRGVREKEREARERKKRAHPSLALHSTIDIPSQQSISYYNKKKRANGQSMPALEMLSKHIK